MIGFWKGLYAKILPSNGLEFANGVYYTYGSGSPEGVLSAPVGSVYVNTANGAIFSKTSGSGNTGWAIVSGVGSQQIILRDQQPGNTNGGTFTSGAWRTRVLNTVATNTIPGASLSSNQITLPAGTYVAEAAAPAFLVNRHQCKLRDTTGSTDLVIGKTSYSGADGSYAQTESTLYGGFTLSTTSVIELQHQCQASRSTDGFGLACVFGVVEVYASLTIWAVA